MTNKQKVEQDFEIVKAAIDRLKEDIELLADEERAEMKEKIDDALGEYTDEIEAIKEFDRTLIEKLGKRGRTFLYIVVGILAIAGIDKAIGWVKGLF